MARLPIPPNNPNSRIPNNPFYAPESNYVQGEYSPFILGSGLTLDQTTGVLSAAINPITLLAGPGISILSVPGSTTVSNTGIITVSGLGPVVVTPGSNPVISVGSATTSAAGVVQLNDSIASTSTSQAATANAVKTAYDLAAAAVPDSSYTAKGDILGGTGAGTYSPLPLGSNGYVLIVNPSSPNGLQWAAHAPGDVTSVSGVAPVVVDNTDLQTPIVSVSAATTLASGVVQLNDTVTSTSTTQAATANAVKTAYDAAVDSVQTVTGTAPVVVNNTSPQDPVISVSAASTSAAGVVQLNDTTSSTSTTAALTAAQGKALQDQIDALSITSNLTFAGTLDTAAGVLVSVSVAGAANGFTIGSPLPAAAPGNADYFVIVTVASPSYTPPGGSATLTHVGDWFLSENSAWQFLDVGFDAPYASTTVAGIVELSTDTETQAGTDATLAVTPASLQSKLSDSISTTSSSTIASSTAVKTAYDLAAAAIPCATITGKGALISGTAASAPVALPVGTDGQVLFACSTTASGLCWSGIPQACPNTYGTVYGKTNFSNTQLGQLAGQVIQNLTGCGATLIGFCAGSILGAGSNASTAVGSAALSLSTCSSYVTAIGDRAMCCAGNTIENVALGTLALRVVTGGCNTALGSLAGYDLLAGCSNVFVGRNAACANTSGNRNVVIGADVTTSSLTTSCELVIGYNAGCNWLTGDSTKAIKPGAGIIDCTDSSGTAGQILMSNGANAICWGSPASVPSATPTVEGIVFGCTAGDNTSLGQNALLGVTGSGNTALGCDAMCAATGGAFNTAVGVSALSVNQGNLNIAVGFCSLPSNNTGQNNIGIGTAALELNDSGSGNIAIGGRAAGYSTSSTDNIAIGTDSLLNNVTGCGNVAIGFCGLSNMDGCFNTVLGHFAGFNALGGSNNVYIGCGVSTAPASGSCQLAIGFATGSNWLTGNSTKAIRPGAGIIDCAGSCGTAGQVLTSNGSNAIEWASSAAPETYTANKALTSGTPINLLSWSGGVRMGSLTVFATDNSTNVKWANITVGSATGIGSTAVITQSVGVGNFTIVAGGGGETIVRLTPSTTLASVDFVYQYTAAFGAQPSVL